MKIQKTTSKQIMQFFNNTAAVYWVLCFFLNCSQGRWSSQSYVEAKLHLWLLLQLLKVEHLYLTQAIIFSIHNSIIYLFFQKTLLSTHILGTMLINCSLLHVFIFPSSLPKTLHIPVAISYGFEVNRGGIKNISL